MTQTHDFDINSAFCLVCGIGAEDELNGVVGSGHWTGRLRHAGTPLDLLRWRLRALLYPGFECELCVGQEPWQGCYCAYYSATSPGSGPSRARLVARALARRWLGIEG